MTALDERPAAGCGCPDDHDPEPRRTVGRRGFLQALGAGAGVLAAGAALSTVSTSYAFAAAGAPATDTLVVLFMRGGQDGLSLVAPVNDSSYQALRPKIKVPAASAVALDATFGMHPSLSALQPLWQAGQLGFVHATGVPNGSRSHFDAQNAMEAAKGAGGWLDRFLGAQAGDTSVAGGTFRAVQRGSATSLTLTGAVPALPVTNLSSVDLGVWDGIADAFKAGLTSMYGSVGDSQDHAAAAALQAVQAAAPFSGVTYQPSSGVTYGTDDIAVGLRDVAQMIKADLGVQVVCLDVGGWDMHENLPGQMPGLLSNLGAALQAFTTDLGPRLATTTIVSMSEFGRRAQENGSAGLDHGSGSLMMLLGGGVRGGKVHGRWPGLAASQLNSGGDLAVTTDYRDVLGELLADRMGASASTVAATFPGWTSAAALDVAKPR